MPATQGDDTIYGTVGQDWLDGLGGNDTLVVFGGNDTLIGGAGGDTMNGGSGVDTVRYDNSSAAVHVGLSSGEAWGGDATGDVLVQIENLVGSQFDDALYGDNVANRIEGGNGADLLYGYGGDDTLYGGNFGDRLIGGAGADLLNGGDGFDTADYGASAQGVLIDFTNHQTSGGDAEGDTLVSIEKVIGSGQGDSLLGDGSRQLLLRFIGQRSPVRPWRSGLSRWRPQQGQDRGRCRRRRPDRRLGSRRVRLHGAWPEPEWRRSTSFVTSATPMATRSTSATSTPRRTAPASRRSTSMAPACISGEGQVRYEQANGDTFIYANTSTAGGPEVVIKLDGLHDLVASDFIL